MATLEANYCGWTKLSIHWFETIKLTAKCSVWKCVYAFLSVFINLSQRSSLVNKLSSNEFQRGNVYLRGNFSETQVHKHSYFFNSEHFAVLDVYRKRIRFWLHLSQFLSHIQALNNLINYLNCINRFQTLLHSMRSLVDTIPELSNQS